MVSFEAPNREGPGVRGYASPRMLNCNRGAAAGRAFEARPVADHGEVAAFRTGIPFEALELRLAGETKGGGGCLSERDTDDGRLGV
jgi:hypothetical protein